MLRAKFKKYSKNLQFNCELGRDGLELKAAKLGTGAETLKPWP